MNIEDGLRAKIRELTEELEEWRSGRKDLEAAQLQAEEIGRAMRRFRLTQCQARAVLLMAKRPNRVVTRDFLKASVTSGRSRKLADAHLSKARQKLILAGIHQPFLSIHGAGWMMDPQAAAKTLEAINAG